MRLLSPIFANFVLSVAAIGWGNCLRSLFPESFSKVDRIALTLLGGLGLLGTLLFLIGQVWFSKTAIVLVLLTGVLLGVRPIIRTARSVLDSRSRMPVPLLPAILVAGVLLVTFVGGLAQPTGDIKMDAIAYHLLGPRVWTHEGVIRPVVDECLTSFPAIVETQFAALMAIGGQRAPGLFSFLALLSMLFIAASLALRCGLDSRAAWWVAALIATMPVLYRGAYGGFVDVIYSGLVLAAARIGFDAEKPRHYALFGIFCGLAMGTKYNALIAVALLVMCIPLISAAVREHGRKDLTKHLGIACVTALIVAAPWYFRNWILLGSPIYPPPPFLLHFFEPRYLPLEAIQKLVTRMVKEGAGMGRGPWSFLLLPFHLTYHPANFMNGAGGIGLTPLILAPFGLLALSKDRFARALAVFGLLQTMAWFATAQEARYIIHVYAIAAIFAVFGWQYVRKASPKAGTVLSALIVAISVSYGFFMISSVRADDIRAVVSSSYEEKRRREEIPFLDSFEYLNHQAGVAKVLVLEPKAPTYYLQASYIKPVGRLGEQTLPDATNLQAVLSQLPALQVSHVLDVRWPGQPFRLGEHPEGLRLIFEREDQRVYAVT
jgi:hypothetical protein